ncbi:hypothetical protein DICSQDRAFT_140799 [Dichomitus squalens LYAD-421 SS1]|uniref:Uncharacterized protein n=2 Tax=Dichomitus squalens TaxID=114155 RepID=R7SL32_DICSQ|nr:uncharacterized protein DICSQDRAFT_140799 [Dichomitus squalens LYAD-421 SS1]EJF56866.1 hypothetical protein DICSQDRAFT_140799 [Dichomitus squalens LYAD-421 SS1]
MTSLIFKLQLSACDHDTSRFTNAESTPSLGSELEMNRSLSHSNGSYTDVHLRDAFMPTNPSTASTSAGPFDATVYNPSHDPTHHTTRTMSTLAPLGTPRPYHIAQRSRNPAVRNCFIRLKPSSALQTFLAPRRCNAPVLCSCPSSAHDPVEMSPLSACPALPSLARPSETHQHALAQTRIGRCALGVLRAPDRVRD